MIDHIKIENYKSLKSVEFSCKRINIITGEPNSGKSNLIEALSFFSPGFFENINSIVRFRTTADLYYDNIIKNTIIINAGNYSLNIKHNGEFYSGLYRQGNDVFSKVTFNKNSLQNYFLFDSPFRYFKFIPGHTTDKPKTGALEAPFGDNLVSAIFSNRDLKRTLTEILNNLALRLQIKPSSMDMEILKQLDEDIISCYPLLSISESLQKLFFYLTAIESINNSVLLFEEPDILAYPPLTSVLVNKICSSYSNQFIITTHNPFFTQALNKEADPREISVFKLKMQEYQTVIDEYPSNKNPFPSINLYT